jgi:predicted RNase H-like nuclease
VIEVHPETSFATLSGAASSPLPAKASTDGAVARVRLLEPIFGTLDTSLPGAKADDVVDAYAALWTAERFAAGDHVVLGDGARDERGLVMRIVT